MRFFGHAGKSPRTRQSLASALRVSPHLEGLETRVVPYTTSGNLWPNPQLLTLSFVPDGTNLGGQGSNLFSAFNSKFGSASTWENIILKAAQQWAAQTNINFAVVNDNGAPDGSGLYQQGDPAMGDIRIGGYNFGNSTLAQAYMPPAINNYSIAGDIAFNTGQTFNIGTTYDLFTVAMHEVGHALGLKHSTLISANMYSAYNGVKSGLTADDISGIRNIYSNNNPRLADQFGSANGSFATAADITAYVNGSTDTALVTNLDITQAGQKEYYKLTAPLGTLGTVTIDVQSSGLSLLAPTVTVYAADQTTVLGTASGAGQYGTTLTVNLVNKVSAGQVIYLKVGGADNTALGTGHYALAMSFALFAPPMVPLPNTQVLNGTPLSGGGGSPNTESQEFAADVIGDQIQMGGDSGNKIAMDGQGNYVMTWSSYTAATGWSVFAERYDVHGVALGGSFQINSIATGNDAYPAVAMDQAGDFVITWASYGLDGSGWGIFARRYDASGNPLGAQFQVNTTTLGDQLYPAIAMDAAGDFDITYSGYNPDGSSQGIFAQRFDAKGNPIGKEVQVNTTPGFQAYSKVAANAKGDTVITWSSYGQDGSGWGVYGRRFDAYGNALGSEFLINTTTAGDQEYSSVGISASGSFVVVWSSHGQYKTGWSVFGQRYDGYGNPLGGEFQVNTTTTGDQMYATVGMNSDGDFLVSWSSNGGGMPATSPGFLGQTNLNGWGNPVATSISSTSIKAGGSQTWGIYAQQFSGDDGSEQGTEFQVNTITTGSNEYSSTVMDNAGHVLVAWFNTAVSGLQSICGQRFVIGLDSLSAPDAGSASGADGATDASSANQGSSFSGQHPDLRALPSTMLLGPVAGLPNNVAARVVITVVAPAPQSATVENGFSTVSLAALPSSATMLTSGVRSQITEFANELGETEGDYDDNSRSFESPTDQSPVRVDQDDLQLITVKAGPMGIYFTAPSGAASPCQETDASFINPVWMSAAADPAIGSLDADSAPERRTMALALTGLFGCFQGTKVQEKDRKTRPSLA
jgi:hypothetical protein